MCRSRAHCVERKKGCDFTSEAPARDPIRRSSSLIRSLRMRDLQRLWPKHRQEFSRLQKGRERKERMGAYCDICGAPECSGNGTSSLRIFAKV